MIVHDDYKCLTPFQSLSHKDTAAKKTLQKFISSATLTRPKSFKKKGKEKSVTRGEALGNFLFKPQYQHVQSPYWSSYIPFSASWENLF